MPGFVCSNIRAEQDIVAGCQCAGCQDAFGTAMLGGPAASPANGATDVPGDPTTTISLTIGTPITGVLEVNGDHDWYAVNLVAGTRYQITLNGVALDGYGALEDPYLYLRNADGILIAQNDDIRNGVLRNSRLNWIAPETGQYFLDAGAWDERFVGGYQLSIIEFIPPTYTLDEIADFLTTGFWGDGGRRWDISADNVITYNVMGLTSAGQTLARAAFASWANVTNLVFEEVTSGGNITLDDNQSGAFAWSSVSNGFITSASINIGIGWLNSYGTAIDSYSFQTYVHEIGHALGFGHGGAYNATATYGIDNLYENDIWSYTIMSYFDQREAGFGTYRVVMGPGLADIVAVHNLYGANTTFNSGDDVYGHNATAGSLYDFANYSNAPAFTVYDTGGADTLDASGYSANQIINLNAEALSSIGGNINNISIARGVVIEGAIGGDGADSLFGNSDGNFLVGNAGADTLDGSAGDDSLDGSAGGDSLIGGEGLDLLTYAGATDAMTIDLAGHRVTSAAGNDTLSGIEHVFGGEGADSILGDAAANILAGGNGADTLAGSAGGDSLIGGEGFDVADYDSASEAIILDLLSGTALSLQSGLDRLVSIEGAVGGQGADSFVGDAGDNILFGNAGDDTLNGILGADTLYGGTGNDLLAADGLSDVFDSGEGHDVVLMGGAQLADILAMFEAWA